MQDGPIAEIYRGQSPKQQQRGFVPCEGALGAAEGAGGVGKGKGKEKGKGKGKGKGNEKGKGDIMQHPLQ